jgi:phosphonate transport system substrate-binding protein
MRTRTGIAAAAAAALLALAPAATTRAATDASATGHATSCPDQVRFGVEPYDSGPKFVGAYKALAKVLSDKLGCPITLFIADNYTAEVEAMRAGKLEIGEFGPLGYIFAHKLAKAVPVAVFGTKNHKPVTYTAALWAPKDSGIKSVADLKGHTIAFADPASTSGNLLPRYALIKAHLDPNKDVKIQFAGSHTASMLALVHGKVDAAEVNSQQQATGSTSGVFKPADFKVIWRSAPIPNDPIVVRGDLPADFQAAVKKALLSLTPAELKLVDTELGVDSGPMIAGNDAMYQPIRQVVAAEHIDIDHIG